MLASERREKIKKLVQSRNSVKISELSELLGVSEMTIHRDIKPLVEEGIVIKTFGGITYAKNRSESIKRSSDDCVLCGRKVDRRLSYKLILPDNEVESACCAHCGLLRHRQLGDQVIQAICYDFFSSTTISALSAWFVMDTSVDVGCCQPQVLTFGRKDQAEGFVKGFGGRVLSFSEAIDKVHVKMACCKHHGRG
ncbi:MAG: DeoR family transcriptional regulator [Actinomycetota bacterium]|nr:DeoR family transcriptional regulator [Actinomycetota bacterium]